MVGKISILYLTGEGRYRRAKGVITPEWATLVQNKKNKQVHALTMKPIFPDSEPIRFQSWQDFVEAPTPIVFANGKPDMMVCEDDFFIPKASEEPDGKEWEEVARNTRRHVWNEAKAKAVHKAAQAHEFMSLMIIAPAMIGGAAVVILGIVVVLSRI